MNRATAIKCLPMRGFPPRSIYEDDYWHGFHKPPVRYWAGGKDFDVALSDVFEKALEGRPSVAIDFNVMGGTPHIVGTRIPVFMVLDAVEYFGTLDGALRSYPKLTIEQVKDAVNYASAILEHPVDYKIESPTGRRH